jgi:cobalt-zinc-cadmium efflux system outer membrane protein
MARTWVHSPSLMSYILPFTALVFLGGCVTAPDMRGAAGEVRAVLGPRGSALLPMEPLDAATQKAPDADVQALLAAPLTAESAVRIAVLNNRGLRAALHELGIARGNLVQAGVLPNPEVHLELSKPTTGDEPLQSEVGLEYGLSELILLPLRKSVAEAERDAERVRVAGEVLEISYRARLAFFDVQARQQRLELRQRAFQAAQASYGVAAELHRVGNISELDLANQRNQVESVRVSVAEEENALLDAREQLNVSLGLHGPQTQWTITARLPEPEDEARGWERLEARAIETSLELAELRHRAEATAQKLKLARVEGVLPHISGGFHGERDERHWEVGASLELSLPLFDRKQGRRMATASELAAIKERYEATATSIRASLRMARNRVESAARRARHYREVLLPAREKALSETLLHYNAMQVGVFQLLQAQREVTEAASAYVDTLLEHRKARAALEQILAGRHQGVTLSAVSTSRSSAMSGGAADSH